MRYLLTAFLVMVALCFADAAQAEFVILEADRDNTMYDEGYPVSNGAGEFLFAGNNGNGLKRRALLRFDVAKTIPAGATIENVELQLYMSRTSVGSRPNSIHSVLTDWGEGESDALGEEGMGANAEPGDATWVYSVYDKTMWNTPGGDFDPTPVATIDVNTIGYYFWGPTPEMIAEVQSWLDDPDQNFGWLILGSEPTFGAGAKRYDSRQRTGASRKGITRPKLRVTYSMNVPGDLTGDGFVNGEDLAILLTNWGSCPGCAADFDGSDGVDGADLAFLLTNWT